MADKPPCPVPECPGDGRYFPPGRGHTCTTLENMLAITEETRKMENLEGL